jgi:hypothetical protein
MLAPMRRALALLCLACSPASTPAAPVQERPPVRATPQRSAPEVERAHARPARETPLCFGDGFCFEDPLPISGDFADAVAFGRDQVFAVTQGGGVVRFDGAEWRSIHTVSDELHAISGTGPNDLYIAGERLRIQHYDGSAWTAVALGPEVTLEGHEGLYTVLAVDANELLVGSLNNLYLRRAGVWSELGRNFSPGVRAQWSNGRAIALAGSSIYERRPDGTYPRDRVPAHSKVYSAYALDETRLFATGEYGEIFRRDADGWHSDETHSRTGLPALAFSDIAARAPDDAWAVSGAGRVLHYDGTEWSPETVPWEEETPNWLRFIEILDDGRILAAGSHLALRDREGRWSSVRFAERTYILTMVMSGPNEAWALGSGGAIAHFDGLEWQIHSGGMPRLGIVAVSGSSLARLHAVGRSGLWLARNERGVWDRIEGATEDLRDVLVRADDVLAVGAGGAMYRYVSGAPTRVPTSTEELLSAIAISNDRVIVAGERYLYALENDRLARVVEMPGELRIQSMHVAPNGDVVVGTQRGGIVRVAGDRARVERREQIDLDHDAQRDDTLTVIASAPDGSLFGAQQNGGTTHRARGRWVEDPHSDRVSSFSIVDGQLWAFGDRVWRWDGGQWIEVDAGIAGWIADSTVLEDGTLFVVGDSLIARRASSAAP